MWRASAMHRIQTHQVEIETDYLLLIFIRTDYDFLTEKNLQ